MASLSADALAIRSRRRQIPWAERYVNILGPLVMIMALCLVMAFADLRFFRLHNIMIILQDASIFMVLAMGMTLVITGRGIDLSIGSIATLSAVIMAMLIREVLSVETSLVFNVRRASGFMQRSTHATPEGRHLGGF